MKSVLGVVIVAATFAAWGTGRSSAADLDKMDWAQLQAEPQPSPLLSWRENFAAHLFGVDRSLTVLRSEYRRGDKVPAARRLAFQNYPERLKNAYQFVDASLNNPEAKPHLGTGVELVHQLKEAEQIAQRATQGKELTAEMIQTLQLVRGLVKSIRYQLLKLDPANIPVALDTSPARRPPALIVEPPIEIPAHAYLEYPLRSTLLQLSTQNLEQRQMYVRRILEDENTRLLEMIVEPGADPQSPSYFLFVGKDVELPGGERKTVRLPFRLTVERVNTDGWWNRLRILANTASDAGVVIRTSLLREVAVTEDLGISAYDTCVTYFRSPELTHRDQTLVTFAANMELTFYRHNTSRLRDVGFRSVVASKCRSTLEQSKRQGALRACEELARQMVLASTLATGQPEGTPRDPVSGR